MRYYQHSGAIGMGGLIVPIFAGISAIALGFGYGALMYFVPFIYIKFLFTLIAGGVLGAWVGQIGKMAKVRNTTFMFFIGLACGCICLYISWGMWLSALLDFLNKNVSVDKLLTNPQKMWAFIQLFAETGVWEIKGSVPSGIVLWICWGIEALCLVGLTASMAAGKTADTPFCENCKKWLEQPQILSTRTAIANRAALKLELEAINYNSLLALSKADPNDAMFTEIQLLDCPGCKQNHYLSVTAIEIKPDDKGNPTRHPTPIVKNLVIQPNIFAMLQEWDTIQPVAANVPDPATADISHADDSDDDDSDDNKADGTEPK